MLQRVACRAPLQYATERFVSIGNVCHICSQSVHRAPPRLSVRWTRPSSNLASASAINPIKDIPPRCNDLHQALEKVKRDALNYVNLNRLDLALRGLESENPTIRIAIMGLNASHKARRLARLLCADPLDAEQQWEEELDATVGESPHSMLLRYGDGWNQPTSPIPQNILSVPARMLQNYSLEVLIGAISKDSLTPSPSQTATQANDITVPKLETTGSFGKASVVRFPVHKTWVLGDGISGAVLLGRILENLVNDTEQSDQIINGVLDLPGFANESSTLGPHNSVSILDTGQAAKAMSSFRRTKDNATNYEHGWAESGLLEFQKSFSSALEHRQSGLKSIVKDLIRNELDRISRNILKEDASRLQNLSQSWSQEKTARPLNEEIEQWAARGHKELQNGIEAAVSSSKWPRLQWWKLLWRTDDVRSICSEMLVHYWLVRAEYGAVWLAGRGAGVGAFDPGSDAVSTAWRRPHFTKSGSSESESAKHQAQIEDNSHWSFQITRKRQTLQNSRIPEMQARAQKLVWRTYLLSSISAALSSLIYLTMSSFNAYNAGAIAALGIAWSLRRLQKRWEHERERFVGDLREDGRLVLKEMEEGMKAEVSRRPLESQADLDAIKARKVAREAVEQARRALQRFERPNT